MVHEGNAYNFSIIFAVALGSFTYGYNSSIIGSVFGLPSFFTYLDISLAGSESASIIGAINGLFAGGGMIGCVLVAYLADTFGRVAAIRALCCTGIVAAIIQAAAVNNAMFLVGRGLGGICAGMANTIVPVYQSEVAPPTQRGRMVGTHGFALVSGYAFAAWSGYGCFYVANPQVQWRLCLGLQIIAPTALLVCTFWIPESPRWLIAQDRAEQALRILMKLHLNQDDPNSVFAREEHLQIQQQLQLEQRGPQGLWQQLKEPHIRKRFFVGLFVQCLAQSTGVLVTSNYQVLLWNNLGLFGSIPLLLYSIYMTWAAFLNLASSLVIDRFGRVRLLVFGFIGCICALIGFSAMIASFGGTSNKVGNAFGVVFLFLFITFYASCIDATSYVYCAEIFPTRLRAQGFAASIFGLFSMTLIYTLPASTAFATSGWKYYLVFIIVPAAGLPLIWRLPETKNLALEEIAAMFGDEVALDLSHLSAEERAKLDAEMVRQRKGSVNEEAKEGGIQYTEQLAV